MTNENILDAIGGINEKLCRTQRRTSVPNPNAGLDGVLWRRVFVW